MRTKSIRCDDEIEGKPSVGPAHFYYPGPALHIRAQPRCDLHALWQRDIEGRDKIGTLHTYSVPDWGRRHGGMA
jgi:hypothetical protein